VGRRERNLKFRFHCFFFRGPLGSRFCSS
jgi:hypothetical protein